MGIPTPSITFDQPLWLKAVEVVSSKKLNIVVRLGDFNCLMTFAGNFAASMEGSRLEKLLQQVFGTNTVNHMMSGKAISRALLEHYLMYSALYMILFNFWMLQNEPSREDFNGRQRRTTVTTIEVLTKGEVIQLKEMYENLSDTDFNSKFDISLLIKKFQENLRNLKDVVSKRTNAGKLWVQYIQYISIIKEFPRAERIGDWKGNLATMGKILNIFSATGYIKYAKSARLYLQ